MRQHRHGGRHRAPAQKHLREAQHARAARKSLQAQLAAGRGPGVGARSPSSPGTASSASGAEGASPARTRARGSVREHKHAGGHMREHKTHCAKRSTRATARKSLQAQLAAGGGPGVGARSPSPRGAESEANSRGGSAPPARRETGSFMRQYTPNTAIPCPALARNKGRRRVNHRDGRRTITATNRPLDKNEEPDQALA